LKGHVSYCKTITGKTINQKLVLSCLFDNQYYEDERTITTTFERLKKVKRQCSSTENNTKLGTTAH